MWKKTWLLGILMAATALSGCSSCGGPTPGGGPDGGGTADGGPGHGGEDGGGGTDGGDGGGGGGGSPTLGALTLSPTTPLLSVTGSTGVSQRFTVTGTFSDGHTEDVTSQANFSIDDTRLGTFIGAHFTSSATVGGTSFVRARIGTTSVSTGITVKLDQKVPDSTAPSGTPPLPADPDTRFGGTVDAALAPKIVYPNNGVMVPPNLGQLEIHFLAPTTTNLFELRFSNTITDVRVYLRCYLPGGFSPAEGMVPSGYNGCIYTPEEKVWKFLAESNRGGQPLRLSLRATSDSGSGKVGVSTPISIQFARAEIRGALYYWTTSTPTGVMRYDFAGTGPQTATPVLRASNINSTGINCVGCHALSRNGKKLVAEVNGQNDGRLALLDLATFDSTTDKTNLAQSATKLSNFESWNPDGSKFVGVYADSGSSIYSLKIFNGDTAAFESEIPNTGTKTNPANHPDWSPDGKTIAYMSMGTTSSTQTNQRSYKGSIRMVTSTGPDTWSEPVTVVPAVSGRNRYYPAIAPDNSFLVYNESDCRISSPPNPDLSGSTDVHSNCNGDSDPSARLWAAKLEANATTVELLNANAGGVMDRSNPLNDAEDVSRRPLTNSYPKWSPFVTRGNNGESSRLMWVTFSSSRKYGLRKPPSASGENNSGTLLWMAAVDPDKVGTGDPSYTAFALPFQALNTSNHIAQWAQYLVSNGCLTEGENGCGANGSTCCNGLQCVQLNQDPPIPCDVEGACVCQAIPQCAPSFEDCSVAAPCCEGLRCLDKATGGDCQGNSCVCTPPCSGINQSCGGASACCDGLKCTTGTSGSICQVEIQ